MFKEKWQKKKGELKTRFTGNETKYFWNNVPKKQNEYQKNINDLLSEDVFKLITNPYAFSQLHWESARSILTEIVGDVSDEEVAKTRKEFQALLEKLENKSLKEYKSQIKSEIKGYKNQINQIPSCIDEVFNNKPEPINTTELEANKKEVEKEINSLETKIQDQNKAQEEELQKRSQLSSKRFELQTKENTVKNNLRNEVNSNEHNFQNDIDHFGVRKDSISNDIRTLKL